MSRDYTPTPGTIGTKYDYPPGKLSTLDLAIENNHLDSNTEVNEVLSGLARLAIRKIPPIEHTLEFELPLWNMLAIMFSSSKYEERTLEGWLITAGDQQVFLSTDHRFHAGGHRHHSYGSRLRNSTGFDGNPGDLSVSMNGNGWSESNEITINGVSGPLLRFPD